MANKWTLKKKAGVLDNYKNAQNIPNTNFGIYSDIMSSSYDDDGTIARLTVVSHGNMPVYFSTKEKLTSEQCQELMNEINNAIKPYIDEIGNKFVEILESKGFIKD